MVAQWNRLRVGRAKEPALTDPIRCEVRVEAYKLRQKAREQRRLVQLKVLVAGIKIVAAVDQVVATIVRSIHKVGVLHQRKEWKSGCLRQVEPIVLR